MPTTTTVPILLLNTHNKTFFLFLFYKKPLIMEVLPTIPEDIEIIWKYDLTKWFHEQPKNMKNKQSDQNKPNDILLFYKDVVKQRR